MTKYEAKLMLQTKLDNVVLPLEGSSSLARQIEEDLLYEELR